MQPILHNGETVKLSYQDLNLGAHSYRSSTFIESKTILIKGEYENFNSSKRNALLVLTDPKSGNVMGMQFL
jgi:hypothetical protein